MKQYPERRAKFIWAWTGSVQVAFAFVMWLERKSKPYPWAYYPLFVCIGIPFLILDCLYNWSFGWLAWGELKGWTYTQRLKYLKSQGVQEAFNQCKDLNRYDPGHC